MKSAYNYFLSISLLLLCLLFDSCKDDESEKTNTVSSASAEWSGLVNGSTEIGGTKVSFTNTNPGFRMEAAGKDNPIGVHFHFPAKPNLGNYDFSESLTSAGEYCGDSSDNDCLFSELANTGEINIIKYDADSLVADFSFETNTYSVTNGSIKAKLK